MEVLLKISQFTIFLQLQWEFDFCEKYFDFVFWNVYLNEKS